MRNLYEIKGSVTEIEIYTWKKTHHVYNTVYVDTSQLPFILETVDRLYLIRYARSITDYALARLCNKSVVALHRYLLNAPKGLVVDHLNFNGLDNRLCNIRLCTSSENGERKPPKNF